MKFEKMPKTKTARGCYCDFKTTHPKGPKSALWYGTWAGWDIGNFCTDCKDEWLKMKEKYCSGIF